MPAVMERERPEEKPARCYFCKAEVPDLTSEGAYFDFCDGCGEFVCRRCDLDGARLSGSHDVEEHRMSVR